LPGAGGKPMAEQPKAMADGDGQAGDALIAALGRCTRPAIVGLAKNAGKTTVLNFLAKSLAASGFRPGIASIGRDGEGVDILTLKKKPRIHLPPGCSCVTTDRLAPLGLELLEQLGGRGVLGTPGIYRCGPGNHVQVELAGVNRIEAMARAVSRLGEYSSPVIVDGALDRRTQGSPALSDGVFLATGATVGNTVELVVRRTMEQIVLLMLPQRSGDGGDGAASEALAIPGAVTDRKVRRAIAAGFAGELIADDWTRIFLTSPTLRLLAGRGVRLAVRSSARLLAVTVNPHNPMGPDLPAAELLGSMRDALAASGVDVPCLDILRPDL
jgi:hypothetical protein